MKCEACSTESGINEHDNCVHCSKNLCAMCLRNRLCDSVSGKHEPAFYGMPTMTCPRCKMEMADFDGFGVLAHVAPQLGACGYCSHPTLDGDTCTICKAVIERTSEPPRPPPAPPPTVTLGDIVNVNREGDAAYVVVALFANRVQVVYCGSQRWYMPEWRENTEITFPAADNKHSRRARRWLDKTKFDPDGWRRIQCGRYGSLKTIPVDHVSMHEAADASV